MLLFEEDEVILLEVSSGQSFEPSGHYPVLAGINAQGEKEYVAAACRSATYPCSATEGATSVTAHTFDGMGKYSQQTETHYYLLVLSNEPLATDTITAHPASCVAAGHLHWRKLTTKGKLQYDRYPRGVHWPGFRVVSRRSGEFVEPYDW